MTRGCKVFGSWSHKPGFHRFLYLTTIMLHCHLCQRFGVGLAEMDSFMIYPGICQVKHLFCLDSRVSLLTVLVGYSIDIHSFDILLTLPLKIFLCNSVYIHCPSAGSKCVNCLMCVQSAVGIAVINLGAIYCNRYWFSTSAALFTYSPLHIDQPCRMYVTEVCPAVSMPYMFFWIWTTPGTDLKSSRGQGKHFLNMLLFLMADVLLPNRNVSGEKQCAVWSFNSKNQLRLTRLVRIFEVTNVC